jgi:hypothetical protein
MIRRRFPQSPCSPAGEGYTRDGRQIILEAVVAALWLL